MIANATHLFEVSWEVCNKVGGIYTVVQSKAAEMMKFYKDNYYLIGPYFADKAIRELSPKVPPENIKNAFQKLNDRGITVHYGTWLIKGKPNIILIDFSKLMENKNQIKTEMWNDYKIDSLNSPNDYDEPVIWGYAVGILLEELSKLFNKKIIAHFHEWLSGSAILYLKKVKANVGTVFTTHATMLGRTLAGNNFGIYRKVEGKSILEVTNLDNEAYKFNVQAKHQLEKASAKNTDVFTTVSEITALEAKYILGREADIIVPNGLDFEKLPNLEDIQTNHRLYKQKIRSFIIPYFFPYYSVDADNTYIYFISGRYEFQNKGIDVTIKALGKLNDALKEENFPFAIVVFFFIPTHYKAINLYLLETKSLWEDLQDNIDDLVPSIKIKMLFSIAKRELPSSENLFEEDFLFDIKKNILSLKQQGLPQQSTHELSDANDIIIKSFNENNLLNREEDKVKVILYPSYLNSSDGLLNLDYYNVIWGSHLGIFPSYYEPWGYTPLECAAYGVPSITTDLTGFGRYAASSLLKEQGVYIIKREGKSDDDVVNQLFKRLLWYIKLSKKKRIECKTAAYHLAQNLGWDKLIENYIKAHDMALGNGTS